MRKWFFILLCICSTAVWAQDFRVTSFSLLESDLTARVDPVLDLNGDACALVRVMADKRFEFSGPLGIVKREDKTAEILLYVPAGTKALTISHPRWGMLRNYMLPLVLEGRRTYELVLRPTAVVEAVPELMTDTLIERPVVESMEAELVTKEIQIKQRKSYPTHWVFMAQAGIGKTFFSGAMIAYLHRVGFYGSFLSNWASVKSDGLECDKNGTLYSTNTTPYYKTTSKQTFYTIDAGATLLLARGFWAYGGAGYGARQKYWETIDGQVVKNKDLSTEGLALSIGTILTYRQLSAQVGLKSIALKDIILTVGVGLSL
ncbi:MAG: hypothetical protein Q4D30_04480 [Bacteroidales bacterium]|nr:hypothetical protein [Bacteroidales bacterium]